MKTILLRALMLVVTRMVGSDVIERLRVMIILAADQDMSGEEKRRQVMDGWREVAKLLAIDIGNNLIDLARAALVAWLRHQQQIN